MNTPHQGIHGLQSEPDDDHIHGSTFWLKREATMKHGPEPTDKQQPVPNLYELCGGKEFTPTLHFRWLKTTDIDFLYHYSLQQLWRSWDGRHEWRDVPQVEEEQIDAQP